MAVELSPKLSAAFAKALTPATTHKLPVGNVVLGYVAIADVDGLSEKILKAYPQATSKSHAVAIFSAEGVLGTATVYTADSAKDAEDTMLEIAYNTAEAMYCDNMMEMAYAGVAGMQR